MANIAKENKAFMHKKDKGRYIVEMNVDGVQKTLFLYPELDEEGLTVAYWSGTVYATKEENQ